MGINEQTSKIRTNRKEKKAPDGDEEKSKSMTGRSKVGKERLQNEIKPRKRKQKKRCKEARNKEYKAEIKASLQKSSHTPGWTVRRAGESLPAALQRKTPCGDLLQGRNLATSISKPPSVIQHCHFFVILLLLFFCLFVWFIWAFRALHLVGGYDDSVRSKCLNHPVSAPCHWSFDFLLFAFP